MSIERPFRSHKQQSPGSWWLKELYDLFEPVRRYVEESGMTEEEVNAILDEALEEVRQERYLKRIVGQQPNSDRRNS